MLSPSADPRTCWRTSGIARPNVFEIDLGAIAHNVGEIRRVVGADVRLLAAVKANGYGFGLLPVCRTLQDAGVDMVAVADLADALVLGGGGVSLPLLIYGGGLVDAAFVRMVEKHGFFATVTDQGVADACARFATKQVKVFVEIDVGGERFGIADADAPALLRRIHESPRLRLAGVYTHMFVPRAADAAADAIRAQLERFGAAVRAAREAGVEIPVVVAASTPVVLRAGDAGFNGIDVGRIIYGNLRSDTESERHGMRIREAFAGLRSRLIHCRTVRADRGDARAISRPARGAHRHRADRLLGRYRKPSLRGRAGAGTARARCGRRELGTSPARHLGRARRAGRRRSRVRRPPGRCRNHGDRRADRPRIRPADAPVRCRTRIGSAAVPAVAPAVSRPVCPGRAARRVRPRHRP
jgi:alanine racemase